MKNGRLAGFGGIILVAILATACARSARPSTSPSELVRAEIERAEIAERARKHDVARAHYENAVATARDPSSIAFARHEFAETLISWGEVAAAIVQLEAVVAAKPDDAGAWHDLGLACHHEGRVDAAIAALERSRALVPRDPRPRIALAALRWKRGDRAGATSEYNALLELDLPERLRTKIEWALTELAKP